ncbi:MAG: PQQ-dependent sugar dehydrogenase [Gammaproteobacteria bacterium]|nr:PQQ-dependent sugar dehydrogenase [Gammaproteobacteria bacterium]MDD9799075.1 PQQ-dependent sugar dehydrogenase [Gammaproteobacteria bacterium]MDD9815561.1 PQQ-dependent sugar dehydrogenase [Gammaproteobacteria bacterium]MDD9851216.1 PQQ-dependent sugar dehydrogenase [Gammaproteobacteria bacterium]MDD9871625.1 PQQ-dependent sugar dehydrogenase [Gammaproteobacteria bacterium]
MPIHRFSFSFTVRALAVVLLLPAGETRADVVESEAHAFRVRAVAAGLHYPWGMAFLPNGDLLVTEQRKGRLRLVKDVNGVSGGQLDPRPITGLPANIRFGGQGGLLDVAVHPDFARNRLVYVSYSGSGPGGAGTEAARGQLRGYELENLQTIFTAEPKTGGTGHYGSRLAFAADGKLFITTGDRRHRMQDAQDRSNHLGAVLRLNDDGSAPADNPFATRGDYKPEIYSYGHRNGQGLALRPFDNSMWMHEHGPRGGDEVNKLDKPGANYGWPAVTYGIDYSGAIISAYTHAPGMEQPVVHWTPSIAPSGMAFYDGGRFPKWKGDLFAGALKLRHLRRLEMRGDTVMAQEILLDGIARIRDVESGPDGYLYILTDERDGRLLRLEPVE